MRAKTFEPSYNTALKCLTYLSEDRRVAESRAFVVLSGNTEKIKGWLEYVDRGEVDRFYNNYYYSISCIVMHGAIKIGAVEIYLTHT